MKRNKVIYFLIIVSSLLAINFTLSNFSFAQSGEDPLAGTENSTYQGNGVWTNNTTGAKENFSTNFSSGSSAADTSSNATPATSPASTASGSYYNQEKIPGYGQTSDFPTYMKQIVNFFFATIGILAMFMLMIGAYQYLMAAGNIAKEDGAKTTISSAFSGLILGLIAYLLLQTINPDLVAFKLNALEKVTFSGGNSGSSSGATPGGGTGTPSSINASNAGTVPDSVKERIAKYDDAVKKYSQQYGVDPNIVRAIIDKESNWDPSAIGKTGDYGIMQINKKSHPSFFANNDWSNYDSSIGYGTKYFSSILKNNAGGDVRTALAMYNGGPGNPQYGYADNVLNRSQKYKNSGYQ